MVEWKFGAPCGSNICVAVEVFKRDVLRIQPSDCDETLSEPRTRIKESFPRGSGDSTSLIRRSPDSKVRHMMDFEEFHDQRQLDKAQWTSEKQIRCADAQWTLDNDSQSSPASKRSSSSESNNGGVEVWRAFGIKTMYGS